MIATIKSVDIAFTNDGSEYRKVVAKTADGKETYKNVFNDLEEKWGILEEGATIDFKLKQNGKYWNVIDISPASLTQVAVAEGAEYQGSEPARKPTSKPPQSKSREFKADPDKTSSIERQVALKEAVNWAIAQLDKGNVADSNGIVKVAEVFAKFIARE